MLALCAQCMEGSFGLFSRTQARMAWVSPAMVSPKVACWSRGRVARSSWTLASSRNCSAGLGRSVAQDGAAVAAFGDPGGDVEAVRRSRIGHAVEAEPMERLPSWSLTR